MTNSNIFSGLPIFFIAMFSILLGRGTAHSAPPPNDNFSNAADLGSALPVDTTGSNVEATAEPDEPFPNTGLGRRSIWWRWTAPFTGKFDVKVSGDYQDDYSDDTWETSSNIYSGTALATLTRIEGPYSWKSGTRISAIAGAVYWIQGMGYTLNIETKLFLDIKSAPPSPLNDEFDKAFSLGTGQFLLGSTQGASLETGEIHPFFDDYGASAWWKWAAPSTGWFKLTAAQRGYDNLVATLWEGASVAGLRLVKAVTSSFGSGSGYESTVYFQATAGSVYPISIGNYDNVVDTSFFLRLSSIAGPPVENRSLTLSGTSVDVTSSAKSVDATFRIVSTDPLNSGSINGEFPFDESSRVAGTDTDGTYTVSIPFPRFLVPGVFRVENITIETGPGGDSFIIGDTDQISFAPSASREITVKNSGEQDREGPVLTSAMVSPTTIDAGEGDQQVKVTLGIFDALSGFSSGYVILDDADGFGQWQFFDASNLASGTVQNGIYEVFVDFPEEDTYPGRAALSFAYIEDGVGNKGKFPNSEEPAFPGPFRGLITVNKTPPPTFPKFQLSDFTVAPGPYDISASAQMLTATFTVETDPEKLNEAWLSFAHFTADSGFGVWIGSVDRISGTATSGTYSKTFPIPAYLAPGNFRASLYLGDTEGEAEQYFDFLPTDPSYYSSVGSFIFPAGSATLLQIINTGLVDEFSPEMRINTPPPEILSIRSSSVYNLELRITDIGTGVSDVRLNLRSDDYTSFHDLGTASLVSGTKYDGVWRLSVVIPTTVEPGEYFLEFSVKDGAGHEIRRMGDPREVLPITLITDELSPFGAWAGSRGLTGFEADLDHDGLSNLMEYAFGNDPLNAVHTTATAIAIGLPAGEIGGNEQSLGLALTFWIPENATARGLTYLGQFSSDGVTWTDVPAALFRIDNARTLFSREGLHYRCTVSDPSPSQVGRPRFGRIRVTGTP